MTVQEFLRHNSYSPDMTVYIYTYPEVNLLSTSVVVDAINGGYKDSKVSNWMYDATSIYLFIKWESFDR